MSNLLRDKELDRLKEIFLFANTPSYLYKNFRQDPTVLGLSEKYSTEELIEFFEQIVKSEKLDTESLIMSYALLFAISLKDYAESHQFLKRIDKYKNLEWIKELQEIILANAKATNIQNINLNHETNAIPIDYDVELTVTQDAQ
ncbi:hypothetical protein L0337_24420 [candidate division KSB1 bacterium]|nr:hypothetical protein [candidate division KSB1 bacterium]